MLNRLIPLQKGHSKSDIEAFLISVEKQRTNKIMRATTLLELNKNKSDAPDEIWNDIDLPDPKEKKNVKLSKKQIVIENMLRQEMIKQWDHIFNTAVEKKRRKIMLTKDEYSIDYDVVNKRELMLPPEYYLNLTKLEKEYLTKHKGKDSGIDISTLRMFLSIKYEIKGDVIHLTNISHFLKIPIVDLIRRRLNPVQNKLLVRVKKRLKLK